MLKSLIIFFAVFNATGILGVSQTTVHVESVRMQGPRLLQEQTRKSAIRDYLQSWQSFSRALDHNSADMLESDFLGTAREKLTDTIENQKASGIRTRYQDRSHDIQIVFYSPDGLSLEITDDVEYDAQLIDKSTVLTTQHLKAHYVVILTPTETRWRVRLFQAVPE